MKCENCGKNEVSFVYRSSINGRTEEHHLCQACAEKLGYTQKLFNRRSSMRDSFFGNDDFFGDFFSPMPSLLGRMNRKAPSMISLTPCPPSAQRRCRKSRRRRRTIS